MKVDLGPPYSLYLLLGSSSLYLANVSAFSTQPQGKSVWNGWAEQGRMGVRLGTSYLDAPNEEVQILTFQALTVPSDPDNLSTALDESDGLNQSKFISEMTQELEVLDVLDTTSNPQVTAPPQSFEAVISSPTVPVGEEVVLPPNESPSIVALSLTNEMPILEEKKETPQDRLAKLALRANEVVAKYEVECNEIRQNFSAKARNESSPTKDILTPFTLLGMTMTTAMIITAPGSTLQLDLSLLQESEAWVQAKHALETEVASIPSLIEAVTNTVKETVTTFSHAISTAIQGTLNQVQNTLLHANPIGNLAFPAPQDIQNYVSQELDNFVEPIKAAQDRVMEEVASIETPEINFNIMMQEIQAIQDEATSQLKVAAEIVSSKLESIQIPEIDVDYVMEQVNSFQEMIVTMAYGQKDIWDQKVSSLELPTIDMRSILDRLNMVKSTLDAQAQEVQEHFRFEIPKIDLDYIQEQVQSMKVLSLDIKPDIALTQVEFSSSQGAQSIMSSSSSSLELANLVDETSPFRLWDKFLSDSMTTEKLPWTSRSFAGIVKLPEYIF
jgi:hypothetical protein